MSLDYNLANQDIVEETKSLILSQFAESDNIQKIAEIIAEEAKSYEEVAEKVFTTYLLTEAEGYSLDAIGEFLNFPREGRDDGAYRTALIVAALGSNSSITRDSLSNLVDILTNGIGGYFVQGNYHDIYVYLQDACVERAVAKDFLDRYLPANTQASVLFESGTSFGFEGNDLARGFDTVRLRAAEGTSFVKYAVGDAVEYPDEMLLPNRFVFENAPTDNQYRTDESTDLKATVRAVEWAIPTTYTQGDVLECSLRNTVTGDYKVGSYVVQGSTNTDKEIMEFISKLVLELGSATQAQVYTDNSSGYKVYLGFEPVTDGALFSGRDSIATEYDPVAGKLIVKATNEVRYEYEDGEGVAVPLRVVAEQPSKNFLLHSYLIEEFLWNWSAEGTVTRSLGAAFLDSVTPLKYRMASAGDSFALSQNITLDAGIHTASVYFGGDSSSEIVFSLIVGATTYEVTIVDGTVVTSDFESDVIVTPVISAGDIQYRVEVPFDVPVDSTSVTFSIGAEATADNAEVTFTCAQVEPWFRATSYIPTTSLATTRAQDFFNFAEEPSPIGFNNRHVFQVGVKDYSGLFAWGCVRMSALTKGEFPVAFGTTLTPVDTSEFTLYDVSVADNWTDGYGDPLLLPTEPTTSAGDFCTRVSLTSLDLLGYQDAKRTEYEYELDSSLTEYVGMEDYTIPVSVHKRPMQTLENYNTFAPPAWDSSLIADPDPRTAGLVTRSPEATRQLTGYFLAESEGIEGLVQESPDGLLIEVGDQRLPNKPYYFEVGVDSLPIATAITDLSFFFESVNISKQTLADGSIDISEHISRITVTTGALPSGNFTLQQSLLQSERGRTVDAEGNSSTKTPINVSAAVSEEYTSGSPLPPRTIGFLVDPILTTVQMFYDGETWDGSQQGYVLIDNVSGTTEYAVGDIFEFGEGYTGGATVYIRGSTDNAKPEPTNPEDYGVFKWIYNHNDLRYTSQLPDNTVDIFGRTIVTE